MTSVRRRSEVGQLLRDRIFADFYLGVIGPGHQLPTVRELAREFQTDPRVIMAVCHDLEAEGIVEIRNRSGVYIAPGNGPSDRVLRRRGDWIVNLFLQGHRLGIPVYEMPERLRRALGTVRLRVGCIECNADQIEELCHELETSYGLEGVAIDCEEVVTAGSFPPELAKVDVVITTHFHVRKVAAAVRRLGKPLLIASHRTGLFMEIQRLLRRGQVHIVLADIRFSAKLRRIFASDQYRDNLHLLECGDGIAETLRGLPRDAPVYVTRAARRFLGTLPLPRPLPELRSFGPESVLPILSFVVRANLAAMQVAPVDPKANRAERSRQG